MIKKLILVVGLALSCFSSSNKPDEMIRIEAYPWLTNGEMNICCLQRMGYTVAEMSALLGVKEASVNRTVYRACERLNIGGNKQVFQTFIQGY